MALHFEELWEKSEKLYQDTGESASATEILEELLMKLGLYKAIDEKKDLPAEDAHKIKMRAFGELLLTLTHLSAKDDINTYEALNTALQYRAVQHYSKKYQT